MFESFLTGFTAITFLIRVCVMMGSKISHIKSHVVTFVATVHSTGVHLSMLCQVRFGKEPLATCSPIHLMVAHEPWVTSVLESMVRQVTFKWKTLSTGATWIYIYIYIFLIF